MSKFKGKNGVYLTEGLFVETDRSGETRTGLRTEADGESVDLLAMPFEGLLFAKTLKINQQTSINSGQLTTYQYLDFSFSPGYALQVSMSGNMQIETIYTQMSTTALAFDFVEFPEIQQISADGDYYAGNNSPVVIQYATATGAATDRRKCISEFTLFENNSSLYTGAFVRRSASSGYNKVYYGPVVEDSATLDKISFINIKKFV